MNITKNAAIVITIVSLAISSTLIYWINEEYGYRNENKKNLVSCYAAAQEDYSTWWDQMCEARAMEPGCELMDGPYEELQGLLARSKEECRLFYANRNNTLSPRIIVQR